MWIVALALRRPYTFVVVALLLLILGPIVIFRTPTDIFPNIDIPVVSILWNYAGLNAQDMSNRIVTLTERDADHDGGRHRAQRIAIAERHRGGEGILPASRQYRKGDRADHRYLANPAAPAAAGDDAAAGHHLQRLHRADSAAGLVGAKAFRAAALRLSA